MKSTFFRITPAYALGIAAVRVNMNGALPRFMIVDDFGNLVALPREQATISVNPHGGYEK